MRTIVSHANEVFSIGIGAEHSSVAIPAHAEAWWDTVRRWSMRAENKVAWLYLARRAGWRLSRFAVLASEVAADQGGGDARSGMLWLANLAKEKVIEFEKTSICSGIVTLLDPLKAAGLPSVGENDRQLPLPMDLEAADVVSMTTAQQPSDRGPGDGNGFVAGVGDARLPQHVAQELVQHVAQHVAPPSPTPSSESSESSEGERSDKSLSSEVFGMARPPLQPSEERRRTKRPAQDVAQHLATDSGAPPAGNLGDAIVGLVTQIGQIDPAERIARIEGLIVYMQREVADPNLRDNPCVRYATAIIDRVLHEEVLVRVLKRLKKLRSDGKLFHEPWMYFTGTMDKELDRAERGAK